MQPLLDPPRNGLSVQLITDLLQNNASMKVDYGALRLDNNLVVLDDITKFMSSGSSIKSDSTVSIHRTCTLNLDVDNPVNYASDFVQPFMTISDPNSDDSAVFFLGVYTLATPAFDNAKSPAVVQVSGYDLLYYLNFPVSDSVQIAVGSNPVAEAEALISQAFSGAFINSVPTDSTLPATQTYPFDGTNNTTYLTIINALLDSCGYQPLWVDWNGVFQILPYVTPTTTNAEWTFDLTADKNIVAEARTSAQDLFDVPNMWVFIMQNLTAAPVEGTTQYTYTDTSTVSPGSLPNRKRLIPKVVSVTAVDYAALVAAGQRQVAQDLTPAETFTMKTSPFPLAWQYDQILMIDPNLAAVPPLFSRLRRVQAVAWTLPLDGTADMDWSWQTVAT